MSPGVPHRLLRCSTVAGPLMLTIVLSCLQTGCSDQKKQAKSLLNEAVERQKDDHHTDAVQLLDRAVALDPNLAEALFARGVSEIALKEYAAAERNIRAALSARADWPHAWWTLATLYRLQDQPADALDALNYAIELESEFTDARFDRACLYETEGRLEEALTDLDQVIRWKPDHKQALLRRASIARVTGRMSEAERDFSRLIKLDRNRERAWYERAVVRKAAGSLERALADVTVACRIDSTQPQFWNLRAELLTDLGRQGEAARDFVRESRLLPAGESALLKAAIAFEVSGDVAESLKCLESAYPNTLPDAEAYRLRARLRRTTGDTDGETLDLEEACRLDDRNSSAALRLAELRFHAGRYEEAVILTTDALQYAVDDRSRLLKLRARVLTQQNLFSRAINDYTDLATSEANRREALAARAELFMRTNEWDQAIVDYSELLEQDVDNTQLLRNRSRAFERAGQLEEAIVDLKQVTAASPNEVDSTFRLAQLYDSLGERDLAKATVTRVHQLATEHSGALRLLGEIYLNEEDFEQVLQLLTPIPPSLPESDEATLLLLRASAHHLSNDQYSAMNDVNRTLELQKNRIDARVLRVHILLERNQPERALQDVDFSIQHTQPTAELYELRGRTLRRLNRLYDAETDLTRALELAPALRSALGERAAVRYAIGRYKDAIADATQCLNADQEDVGMRLLRADALMAAQQFKRALSDIDGAISRQTDLISDMALLWKKCQCRIAAGDLLELVKDLDVLLEADAGHHPARLARARLHVENGQLAFAMADLDLLIDSKAVGTEALLLRGSLLHRTGRFERAIDDFCAVIAVQPDLAEAWFKRSLVYTRLERYSDARSDVDRALQLDGDLAGALYLSGNLYAQAGETDLAIVDYRGAIEINAGHLAAWYNCGNLLFESRQFDEAIACWDEAIRIQPDLFRAWNNRASAYMRTGRTEEAIRDFEHTIELNPAFARAYDNLAWLLATADEVELRDLRRALELSKVACELTSHSDWSMLSTLAACQAEAKDFSGAEETARSASELAPPDERLGLNRLARIYHSQATRQAVQERRSRL